MRRRASIRALPLYPIYTIIKTIDIIKRIEMVDNVDIICISYCNSRAILGSDPRIERFHGF